MTITGILRDSCPNGIDCDRIHDTDGPDLVFQARLITDPTALGLPTPPPGEAYFLFTRDLLPELGVAP